MSTTSITPAHDKVETVDAVVVGAGFAGMYMIHKLREMGLTVAAFEAGSSVGGTWYWNRYPGARCDTKSLGYSFSFSEELWTDWSWTEEYAAQPEIEAYMNYVADRLGLRSFIEFEARVESAVFNDATRRWTVQTDSGTTVAATYVFMATGGFSSPVKPDIAGFEDFEGEVYYTSQWPEENVSFEGKRVGIIGTGSSGMQAITEIGHSDAFTELTVFQRTANFAVPGRNKPLEDDVQQQIKSDFDGFWDQVRRSGTGFVVDVETGPVATLDDDQFAQRMEEAFAAGGPTVLGWVTDLLTDERSNHRVAEYLRAKVDERVEDPATAEKLKPKGFHVGSRRQLVENGYFEVYNNPKVTLVDVKADPIVRFTSTGLVTGTTHHELDVIILATGFDSGTGALTKTGLVGEGGLQLTDKWASGPTTYLGLMVDGFPNCFMIAGPGSPSIRSVVTGSIEHHVEWLADLLGYMRREGIDEVAPSPEAETAWTAHVAETVDKLLLSKDDTQYFGSNVPGKPRVYLAYVGGVQAYRSICARAADDGYEGFVFSRDGNPTNAHRRNWSGPLDATTAAKSNDPALGGTLI